MHAHTRIAPGLAVPILIRVLGLAVLAAGCTETALMVGAQASQAGVTLYERRGGFDAWHLAHHEDVVDALERAAEIMDLETTLRDDEREHEVRFEFRTARDEDVEVQVQCQGDAITVTRFEVGWLGSPGLARLLYKLLLRELGSPGAPGESRLPG